MSFSITYLSMCFVPISHKCINLFWSCGLLLFHCTCLVLQNDSSRLHAYVLYFHSGCTTWLPCTLPLAKQGTFHFKVNLIVSFKRKRKKHLLAPAWPLCSKWFGAITGGKIQKGLMGRQILYTFPEHDVP